MQNLKSVAQKMAELFQGGQNEGMGKSRSMKEQKSP